MATRAANLKGIKFLEESAGAEKGGVALVVFDLLNVAFTGGSDTIQLGGGGFDRGVATTNTLAVMIQNQRRDGKTVTITGVAAASVVPALQAGVLGYIQSAAASGGNITSMLLKTAASGGSDVTFTSASWDRTAAIAVTYTAA